jgi:hypothetical protein
MRRREKIAEKKGQIREKRNWSQTEEDKIIMKRIKQRKREK